MKNIGNLGKFINYKDEQKAKIEAEKKVAVEKVEKQCNAQLARNIIIGLPNEIPNDQLILLVKEYCMDEFVSKGMCCDIAIHDKGDGNPHAHILLTMRALDEHGEWMNKSKKVYILDEDGNKIKLPSGNYKTRM